MDVVVFNRLRLLKAWWVAPAASTLFGNLVDTIAFFTIAFWRSTDPSWPSTGSRSPPWTTYSSC